MQHIFIINPAAGKSDATKHISKMVHSLFMNNQIEGTYRIEKTSSSQNTTQIAKKYAQSGENVTLYACGGDGTLYDVLNGCIGYDNVILAHMPIGTGNDFIKYFGSRAKSDFLNLEELMNGTAVEVDVLKINDKYSINIANIGLDAMVAYNASKFKKLPLIKSQSAYKISLAYSFFTSTSHSMKIKVDGVEEKEDCFTFVVAANAKYYGGNYCAAPFANIQDGFMDVILIPKISRLKILRLMDIYEKGEHLNGKYDDIVHYRKARKIEIISDHQLEVCLEGEISSFHNPVIEIADQKIKLLVPQKYTKAETLIQHDKEERK